MTHPSESIYRKKLTLHRSDSLEYLGRKFLKIREVDYYPVIIHLQILKCKARTQLGMVM